MPAAKPYLDIDLKHAMVAHSHGPPHNSSHNSSNNSNNNKMALVSGSSSAPRSSAGALLSLSQDITALVSLSIEATASLVNDYVRTALGTIGVGELVRPESARRGGSSNSESGAGLAVVVVGASDPTGQSLTLRLAKSGYTVFPFVPVSAPGSTGAAPASSPFSALLLAWSGVQKRLQARDPDHTGAVVPLVIDDMGDAFLSANPYTTAPPSPPRRGGRFAHAGETVRAYCRENGLALVAIVCAAPPAIRPPSPRRNNNNNSNNGSGSSADTLVPCLSGPNHEVPLSGIPTSALARTDEEALIALYRANILDPLCVVRALGDLLVSPRGDGRTRGRVLFVETNGTVEDLDPTAAFGPFTGAARMISAARAETARLLRAELGGAGIDVCEIVVGPMAPRLVGPVHLRSSSGDSDTDCALAQYDEKRPAVIPRDGPLASRIRLLARIFAVDDALVYSCVRRAIEDRYPRARHHAGLAPLLSTVANATPGAGIVRFLGRWVLGRLFAGSNGR